ncbi:MAG: type II toxin-antitoxin system HicB family antitoxin [Acidobacteria bacterium]|nr:type II toxin-antitoxin system HicB family antitoxin [Acidobacteriota bacterium]
MERHLKIVVEKHVDTYVAYPIGTKGVVVGQGPTYEAAMADVRSAISFHVDTFGADDLGGETSVVEAFIAEASITV